MTVMPGMLWASAESITASQEEQALQLCEHCVTRSVSGVFFASIAMTVHSAEVNRRVMRRLKEAGIPVVLQDRRPEEAAPRERVDLVGIDNPPRRISCYRSFITAGRAVRWFHRV